MSRANIRISFLSLHTCYAASGDIFILSLSRSRSFSLFPPLWFVFPILFFRLATKKRVCPYSSESRKKIFHKHKSRNLLSRNFNFKSLNAIIFMNGKYLLYKNIYIEDREIIIYTVDILAIFLHSFPLSLSLSWRRFSCPVRYCVLWQFAVPLLFYFFNVAS